MRVLAFGSLNDMQAWEVADKLEKELPRVKFLKVGSIDDVIGIKGDLIIMDAVKGIKKPRTLKIDDLKKRELCTLHDFDIGFFLKVMKGIGKMGKVKIIGIPMKIDKKVVEDVKKLIK